jgi:hypothetical protein
MRHIFHTCLLALRLISSVDANYATTFTDGIFESDFVHNALEMIFIGDQVERKRNNNDSIKFTNAGQMPLQT